MATTTEDDDTGGGRSDKQLLADAMNRLRTAIDTVETENLPFDRAYVSADDPNDILVEVHSRALDFRSAVAAYEREIKQQSKRRVRVDDEDIETNLWVQDVYTASVPEERVINSPGRERESLTEFHEQMDRQHPQLSTGLDDGDTSVSFEEVGISLETLSRWDGWTRRHDVKQRLPGVGPVVTTRKIRMVVPIAAARRIYEQLRRCLNAIGLLEDVEEEKRPFHDWGEDYDGV